MMMTTRVFSWLVLVALLIAVAIVALPRPAAVATACSGGPVPSGGLSLPTTRPDGSHVCVAPP